MNTKEWAYIEQPNRPIVSDKLYKMRSEKRMLFSKLLFKHNASTLAMILSCSEIDVWKIETGQRELDDIRYRKLQAFNERTSRPKDHLKSLPKTLDK